MSFDGDRPEPVSETDMQPLVCRTVCSLCRRSRAEDGSWVEDAGSLVDLDRGCVSHGICPDCLRAHYPEFR